ncbi:MAG TPA: site-2 protease family protein [Bacilli bacterium]
MDKQGEQKRTNPWRWLGLMAIFLLSKWKSIFVLLKFSKFGTTFISMAVTLWLYAVVSTLQFAIGLVAMIFIHELGHVFAAKQKGLPVSAPLFIPFLGALITLKRNPRDAVTEAYIAIGGPILGTVGALVALWIGLQWDNPHFLIAAYIGFFLNLVNLLPIHPLDGGRIATAVSRWLWLFGVFGGLVVIIMLKAWLLFIIWALFVWDLYQKYIKNPGKGKKRAVSAQFEVPVERITSQGMMVPGEEHKRELSFQTYSTIDGQQKVEIFWDTIGLHGTIPLIQQGLIERVHIIRIEHQPRIFAEKIVIHCQVDYEVYENDKYYDVPPETRWKFGLAYGGLAILLIYMLYYVQGLGLQDSLR